MPPHRNDTAHYLLHLLPTLAMRYRLRQSPRALEMKLRFAFDVAGSVPEFIASGWRSNRAERLCRVPVVSAGFRP
jgi:hypothetical protein